MFTQQVTPDPIAKWRSRIGDIEIAPVSRQPMCDRSSHDGRRAIHPERNGKSGSGGTRLDQTIELIMPAATDF
jgi:hypothetical protein